LVEQRKFNVASTARPGEPAPKPAPRPPTPPAAPPPGDTKPGLVRPGGPRFRAPQEPTFGPPSATGAGAAGPASGRTTLPPKQHIRCYECNYEFDLTGRMHSTHCPKCKISLDLAGYTIDSESREDLKTLGAIRVTPRGTVSSARMIAADLDLAGKVSNSIVLVFNRLTVHPGSEFTRGDIDTQDLRIEPGAGITIRNPAVYRNVDVAGTLNSDLYVTGTLTVRATGSFTGSVHGGHLVVEDGATFVATVQISPDGAAEAARMKEQSAGAKDTERIVAAVLTPPEETPEASRG
jgi:cytoskeletal protein CcmA (bactofilin family)